MTAGFTHNSQIVLHDYAESQRVQRSPDQSMAMFWEFFVAGLATRPFDLSDEQLLAGTMGGGGDGGIDFIYTLVDGEVVGDDFSAAEAKNSPTVTLVIGQAKTSTSFREDALNRLIAVTRDLLTLATSVSAFSDVYSGDIRSSFALFRSVYRSLLLKVPTLRINYIYAVNRPPANVSSGITNRAEALRQAALEKFSDATVRVELLGAQELWAIASQRPKKIANLKTQRVASGRSGYVCLVTLDALDDLLRPDGGELNQTLFDSNVRHYLKSTSVNKSIADSLDGGINADFWWLNNGITIISSSNTLNDDVLTISDPQIVNGLQTSIEVAKYFEGGGTKPDTRALLVKVISVATEDIRDAIIRATNFQNQISPAMLRATEDFQRSIESYFQTRGLYYDRRKGYWAGQGKPIKDILSITFLAQAVLAILLFKPDDARGGPSRLIKNEETYKQIFSEDRSLAVFYVCASLSIKAESYLRKDRSLPKNHVNNLRFYLAMFVAWIVAGTSSPDAGAIEALSVDTIDTEIFASAFETVYSEYQRLGASDNITKNTRLKNALKARFDSELGAPGLLL